MGLNGINADRVVGTHKGAIIDGTFPRGCIYQHNVDISIETGRKWTGSSTCTSCQLVHSSFKSCLIIGGSDSKEVNENGTGFYLVLKILCEHCWAERKF